ncbi:MULTISPECIES: hypothetical protein [Burkholderia cepacia complex]|uniref:Uncharacterized protein n=1 Tax=Burkholderia cepacia TaxID=292 RepID=A0AAX2RDL8_BURCE|nr:MULTISPECIES: hypothetical protein [Burkholderia cepacia complex]TES96117.1 hypothetical protein E3D36_36680 [Burkholderia cepacia]TEU32658.1 hypothetical protein E3D37_42465 [Burkholderia cepacia]TEU33430.1 hypothetical protein E3D38_44555 [Burkholderia cepacia]TEU90401.1 hypothetical protein E3D40_35060 [Burkholderia cepacia]TEU99535.1 hypothetical protein E3D44_37015 [Burkholderia cepacia]
MMNANQLESDAVQMRAKSLRAELDEALTEQLQARMHAGVAEDGEHRLQLANARVADVARRCYDAGQCLDSNAVQAAGARARAEHMKKGR